MFACRQKCVRHCLEHRVAAGRFLGNVLSDIPMFDNLAVFDAENINDRPASVLFVRLGIQVKSDEIALGNHM